MKFALKFCAILTFFYQSPLFAIDCKDPSLYKEISYNELTAAIQSKSVFVIDVNSKDSFEKNKIPTAIHYGQNKGKLSQLLPKDKKSLIVSYCGGPTCTAWKTAAIEACNEGYTNIMHFKGGIKGWLTQNQTVKTK